MRLSTNYGNITTKEAYDKYKETGILQTAVDTIFTKEDKTELRDCGIEYMGERAVKEVEFTNGQTIEMTPDHRVYGPKGWVELGDLVPGDEVYAQSDVLSSNNDLVDGYTAGKIACVLELYKTDTITITKEPLIHYIVPLLNQLCISYNDVTVGITISGNHPAITYCLNKATRDRTFMLGYLHAAYSFRKQMSNRPNILMVYGGLKTSNNIDFYQRTLFGFNSFKPRKHVLNRDDSYIVRTDSKISAEAIETFYLQNTGLPSGIDHTFGLYGWILADGWITTGKKPSCGFSYSDTDEGAANELKIIFESIVNNVKPNAVNIFKGLETNVFTIRSDKRSTVNYFDSLFNLPNGYKERDLRVPELVFNASLENKATFISAVWGADGSISDTTSTKCSIRLTSVSKGWLKDIQLLLLEFGIYSTINKNNSDKCGSYNLVLNCRSHYHFYKFIGFKYNSEKQLKLEYGVLNRFGYKSREGVSTVTVKAVRDLGIQPVYDIEEPTTNTLIVNGLVVHNCLLGSINLTKFVLNPFTPEASFDWEKYRKVIVIFTRMLDNVVEINNLPLQVQRDEITNKRRHGMGYLGLGSVLVMLGMRYGDAESLEFTSEITKVLAVTGFTEGVNLAKLKGPAPILDGSKAGLANREMFVAGKYMQRLIKEEPTLKEDILAHGCRFTHHSSIAPTGCIAPNSLVVTEDGLEAIGDLGDIRGEQWQDLNKQVSSDGGYKNASKFYINGVASTIAATTGLGRMLEGTHNHQIRVMRDTGYVWVRMDELRVGDVVPTMVNNYPTEVTPVNLLEIAHTNNIYSERFKLPTHLTVELAEFIGFLHANGNIKTNRHIRLFHHSDYADSVFDRISDTLNTVFGIDSKRVKSTGETYVKLEELHIHSVDLVKWLYVYGLDKIKSTNIDVPKLILLGGRDVIYAYLRGVFEGDGSNCYNSITLTSTSFTFVSKLQVLMQSVGISSRLDITNYGGVIGRYGDNDVYRLAVSNYVDRVTYMERVGFISNKGDLEPTSTRNIHTRQMSSVVKHQLLKSFNLPTGNSAKLNDAIIGLESTVGSSLVFDTVTSICEGLTHTYDISVPDNLTYTANNFISHNTISLSLGNNASNGIEPSFAHHYTRNVIREGKSTKEAVGVYSYELLAYRSLVDPDVDVDNLPDMFYNASDITPFEHVDIQAAAQYWLDSSVSKTISIPTEYPIEDFKRIYKYAYEQGLKGATTFRFNPEVFQGVLVTKEDLDNTNYEFTLADGTIVKATGNDKISYKGELHDAPNLFDGLKEGTFGKY